MHVCKYMRFSVKVQLPQRERYDLANKIFDQGRMVRKVSKRLSITENVRNTARMGTVQPTRSPRKTNTKPKRRYKYVHHTKMAGRRHYREQGYMPTCQEKSHTEPKQVEKLKRYSYQPFLIVFTLYTLFGLTPFKLQCDGLHFLFFLLGGV